MPNPTRALAAAHGRRGGMPYPQTAVAFGLPEAAPERDATTVARVRGVAMVRDLIGLVRDPIRASEAIHRRHGRFVAFEQPAGRPRSVMVADPALNEQILTATDYTRPSSLWALPGPKDSIHKELRNNYLSAYGEEHAKLAAATVPSLSRRSVSGYFDTLKAIAAAEVDRWPVGEAVDLYALVRGMGRQAAFRLLFDEPDPVRTANLVAMLERYHARNWSIGAFLFPVDLPGTPYRRLLRMAEKVADEIGRWVAERNGAAQPSIRAAHAALTDGDGHPLSAVRRAANISFLSFASFETMSSALTWILFLLALHPRVLADLVDEIESAGPLADIGRDRLGALPLLDSVVKEALRLIPPTPVLIWRTHGDKAWQLGGEPLGVDYRKTQLLMAVHVTHRLPDIYAEPGRFMPQRWSSIRPSPYAYLPFGGGPRRCPGGMFGTDFLKAGLAAIVTRHRLEIRDGTRIDYVFRGLTMPKAGIPVALAPQDRTPRAPQVAGDLRRLVAVD